MQINRKIFLIKLKKAYIDFLQIICGTVIMALGIALLLVPNKLSTGGFSGLATAVYYLVKIPVGKLILMLNIPLFIVSFFKLGKKIFVKGIIGTILLSIFVNLFEKMQPPTSDRLLASIYGGILSGTGTAFILKANASTGGSDLLSQIIRKYKPEMKNGTIIVVIDTIIVAINVLVFREIEIALYSAIAIFIMGKTIDIFLEGIYFTKVVYIVSDKYNEIAARIANGVKRGTTGLYAKGMYTNDEKMLLLCVAGRNEVSKIQRIVKETDDKAFLIISNAREVIGKGFKDIL